MSFHGQMTETPDTSRTALPPRSLPVYDARRLTDGEGTAMIVLDDKTYCYAISRGRAKCADL